MLGAESIVLSNGFNVEDYIEHLQTISEMSRNNNIKFCVFNYNNIQITSESPAWVNPTTINVNQHGNISDDNVARIVTIDGQQILKLSPNYFYFIITEFNLAYVTASAQVGILAALDYWVNGEKASVPYQQRLHIAEGTILGTSRGYAERKLDIKLITPSETIDGYSPAFSITTDVKPEGIQEIQQYIFAINTRMR